MNVLGLILSFVLIFIIIGIATVFQKNGVLGDEGARKFIHIGVSNWWILAMLFFDNIIWASIAPVVFILLNYVSFKMNLIKAMERSGKGTLGTVYFPISLLILVIVTFLIEQPFIGAIGILILGYGDGLAAVIGKKYGKHKLMFGKSVEGTITMFVTSLIVSFSLLVIFTPRYVWLAVLIALFATVVEVVTPKGLDNLSVPLLTSAFSYLIFMLVQAI